jgi:hypothetical protein
LNYPRFEAFTQRLNNFGDESLYPGRPAERLGVLDE